MYHGLSGRLKGSCPSRLSQSCCRLQELQDQAGERRPVISLVVLGNQIDSPLTYKTRLYLSTFKGNPNRMLSLVVSYEALPYPFETCLILIL